MKTLSFLLLFSILLSACGGGGGGGGGGSSPTVNLQSSDAEMLVDSPITLTWSSSNATSCSASGDWSGTKTVSGSESINIPSAAAFTYTLLCSGSNGSTSRSVNVSGYQNLDGVTVDGYIRLAEIFIDINNNFEPDFNEITTISDNFGAFTLRYADGNLISLDGFDLGTGNLLDNFLMINKLDSFSPFVAITPITTIASFMDTPENINLALGIDPSIDISATDPEGRRGTGEIYDYLYEKGNQATALVLTMQNIANNSNLTQDTSQDYFNALAEELEASFVATQTRVDIETNTFIDAVLENIVSAKALSITEDDKTNLGEALSSVMPVIEVKGEGALNTALFGFMTGTFQTDMQSIADGTASIETLNSYSLDVISYIAVDQNISAEDLTPNVTAVDDITSTNEDETVEILVLSNDSYVTAAPIGLTAGEAPSNGTIEIVNGVISYTPIADFNGTDSFGYLISQQDKVSTGTVTVTVTPVNDAPNFVNFGVHSVVEGVTFIMNITATDVDDDPLFFSTPDAEFSITQAGVLSFVSIPDFETKTDYTVNVAVSDGEYEANGSFTLHVLLDTDGDGDPDDCNIDCLGSGLVADSDDDGDGVADSSDAYPLNANVHTAPVATAADYFMNLKPQSQTAGNIILDGTAQSGHSKVFSIVSNGSYGTASVNSATGALTYTTASSTQSSVVDSFTFRVNDGFVDSATATISIDIRTDPLYTYQWHLNNTGQTNFASSGGLSGTDLNLDAVISSGIDGSGVVVAIVDEGLEIGHEDLSPNVVLGKSWDYVGSDDDPTSTATDGDHGTSVAGIVAAVGWNKLGGRGVAPDAELVGYNYLANQSTANQADALGDGNDLATDADVDIFNMSYGYGASTSFHPPLNSIIEAALENGVTNYRDGKGAIYVKSSGNGWTDSGKDDDGNYYVNYCGPNESATDNTMSCQNSAFRPTSATPYVTVVSALNADNERASYSSPGSAVWVSGFGGQYGVNDPAIMTTDQASCSKGDVRTGSAGRNDFNDQGNHAENASCNYTSSFNGTSSAAPSVSGVVALMLEANPALTWRDVKHILATTSTQVDALQTYSYLGVKQYEWETNAVGNKFHNWYGFGRVNAAAAVLAAQNYSAGSLGAFVDSGLVSSGVINHSIPEFSTTARAVTVAAPAGSEGVVEFVRISIAMSHTTPKDLGLRLVSPSGTVVNIMSPFTTVSTDPDFATFEIGVNALYGESMDGEWVLRMDEYTNDNVGGTLESWDIRVYGH